MKQFDLYTNTDEDTCKTYPYFVDIQSGLLNALNSRVVIPLTPASKSDKSYPDNLCPIIKIKSKCYALLTHLVFRLVNSLIYCRLNSALPEPPMS